MNRIFLVKTCKNTFQANGVLARSLSRQKVTQHQLIEAGFGKFLVILAPFAVCGGVAAYAKHDNEFRKTLVKSVPAVEPVLKVVLQEENPFAEVTKRVESAKSTVLEFFGSSSEKKVDVPKPQSLKRTENDEKSKMPVKKADPVANVIKPASTAKNATSVPMPTVSAPPITAISASAVAPPAIEVPNNIVDLENTLEKAASKAIEEYNRAISIMKTYNKEVRSVVDDAIENVNQHAWASLKNKTSARDMASNAAEKAASDAKAQIDKLQAAVAANALQMAPEVLTSTTRRIQNVVQHIESAKSELYRAKSIAGNGEKYWRKVEAARNYFLDEMESLFPGIDLAQNKLEINKEDMDLFVLHAYSHVLTYQKELQKLKDENDNRILHTIEAIRGQDQSESVKAQVQYELDRAKSDLAIENQRKITKIKSQNEKDLRLQMKRQAEAHLDHLNDVVGLKEDELKRKYEHDFNEKLSNEQALYKVKLASMIGKLKGMDDALKARADAEKSAHQAQSLWSACQALWLSVRSGDPAVPWQMRLRPLVNEIKAVGKAAAEGDELVKVVLDAVPAKAYERGVYPEDALRERFLNVDRVARRLALVPEEGGRLPLYLMSYLQSMLILTPDNPISKEELQNKEVDFGKLDTYEILNRARYWLDRGDLMQTVRYVNLLKGAPRKAASDWLNEARLLLETQQAVNALMAHAAASGMLYL